MGEKTIRHFKNISFDGKAIKVRINFDRLNKNVNRAQYWLDSQVMTDMVPFMPHNSGTFVNLTRAQSAALAGSGVVVAAAPPMGRFLYMGKLMVDPETGSPFARPGAKKIVTERPLTYSNPKATPMWFDTAKERHEKEWVAGVQKRIGGE